MAAKKKNTKEKILIGAVVILALLLVGIAVLYVFQLRKPKEEESGSVVLDKNAVDFSAQTSEEEEPLTIRFPGYPEITVDETTESLPIVLTNPEGNPCYFQFELRLEDEGVVLGSTDWVEPGKAVQGIDLSEKLSPGTYSLTIQISTRSLEDQSPMNGGNVQTTLHVTQKQS